MSKNEELGRLYMKVTSVIPERNFVQVSEPGRDDSISLVLHSVTLGQLRDLERIGFVFTKEISTWPIDEDTAYIQIYLKEVSA